MKSTAEVNEKIDEINYEHATRPAAFWALEAHLPEKIKYTVWNRMLRAYLLGGMDAVTWFKLYGTDVEIAEIPNIIEWLTTP